MTDPGLRLELRPYQSEAIDRVLGNAERGVRSQLGVAATGLGKTIVFAALAKRLGGRALVLAHRDELVQQAAAKVAEVWPGVDIGIVKGARNDVHAHVVVASVQTLARPNRMAHLLQPFTDPGLLSACAPFDLVVVDEAHHAAADSYRSILDALRAGAPAEPVPDEPEFDVDGQPAGPLLLGVTATPDRGDGKGLADLFAEVAFSYDMLWGIRSGYLSDLRGMRVTIDALDLDSVKVSRGDYAVGDAGRALHDAAAPKAIVKAWQTHAAERRTLVFTPTVALAQEVTDAYTAAGVAAGMVSGGTPIEQRRQILAAYSAGGLQVLVNCAVLTEGYDEPRTDCIVIARPTRSRALYAQMVGRGTRRHPDKTDCLVLDVVGASAEHDLVTVPSLFGITDGPLRGRLGDGSAGVARAIDEHEAEQVRLGKMRAEDVDLFAKMRAAGVAWVPMHQLGDDLRRYHRPLGRDLQGQPLPTVVLVQRSSVVWSSFLWWPGDKRSGTDHRYRPLIQGVDMETAQGVAEDYARKFGGAFVRTDAAFRTRRPTARQLASAKRWRLPDPGQYATAGELSDALDRHIQRRKLARR